jgi:conjugative relaxase-like TrwC/TraI family protein
MLTISRLKRRSIAYYNDTANEAKHAAMDRQKANGGLAEYYSEGETRIPSWLVVGDKQLIGQATGLSDAALDGGDADTEHARIWLDEGQAPNGTQGREFTDKSVHGFDLTFAAPKSVSLIRALTDDIAEKVLATAHTRAAHAAMAYLREHAGYTRVYNRATGNRDLQRLPGLVAIAYQHETSRCGDPHLHTHVIVPNRQPRADGQLVSLDSKSLYHEAKAAGMIYQATLRHELHAERGFEFNPVDGHTGMAEIAGIGKDTITAWSQRSTRLREWAKNNLTIVDGQPSAAQLAAAQKATRPAKPESLAWEDLKQAWRADARGLHLDRDAHFAARAQRRAAHRAAPDRAAPDRARIAQTAAHIDKPAFTRADMVELVGAQLPVDAPGDPRALIEGMVEAVSLRISAPRITARATNASPSTRSSPRSNASSPWSMTPTTAPAWMCAPRTWVTCRPIRRARSATSRSLPIWCSRCRRPRARARPTPSKRCARPRTARASRCWCSHPPARRSMKPWPKVPETAA